MTLSTCYKNDVNYINDENKWPFCITNVCGTEFHSLVDTRSSITAMDSKTFKQLMGEFKFSQIANDIDCSKGFRSANGGHISVFGKYIIPFSIGDKTYNIDTCIINNLACSTLLGADFVRKTGMIINGKSDKLFVNNKVLPQPKCPKDQNGNRLHSYVGIREKFGET